MKTKNRQFDKRSGSALILVVVVTVLLAVVGVMFLMVSRASELETGSVARSKDLDAAVDTVVARIKDVLFEDLLGSNNILVDNDGPDESYDAANANDAWLSTLEPYWFNDAGTPADPTDDNYAWAHPTDLFNTPGFPAGSLLAEISSMAPPLLADADGDGVTDSYWVPVPGLTTSRGEPVYAAIRIIDNCAMLNLNGAFCFFPGDYDGISLFEKQWYERKQLHPDYTATSSPYNDNQNNGSGHYLTEINYLPFLRGYDLNGNFFDGTTAGDDWYNLLTSKNMMMDVLNDIPFSPQQCQAVFFGVENSSYSFPLFDVSDELELRNRYLLTSFTESRIEQKDVLNFTLDSGGGDYAALRIPRENKVDTDGLPNFYKWKMRVDSANFDVSSGGPEPFRYDRRHVCTVYSYDRDFRRNAYPLLQDELRNDLLLNDAQIAAIQQVFWPVGPVTTDIQTSLINYKHDEPSPTILYPYAGLCNNVESRRKILHLLFAFREYFSEKQGMTKKDAAKKAAQVVANIIDYSDDDAIVTTSADRQGPFYHPDYGEQANVDCTFITEAIIEDMIEEVSTAYGFVIPAGTYDFGFPAGDVVFGYEKQPFISEIYADWDGGLGLDNALKAIGIEVVNPYSKPIDMEGWALKIGENSIVNFDNDPTWDVPEIGSGRAVFHGNYPVAASMTISGTVSPNISELDTLDTLYYDATDNVEIQLLRPAPANSGHSYICVDVVSDSDMRSVLGTLGAHRLQRDDDSWEFIYADYAPVALISTLPYELGTNNTQTVIHMRTFQIGVADDMQTSLRWHDLEVMALYGNGSEDDPNAITSLLADSTTSLFHFDLDPNNPGNNNDLFDYIAPINRPDDGSVPGRININTAPAHVIAAAIPPTLADPNAAIPGETVTFSALQLAQSIVNHRPYEKLGDLLTNVPNMKRYFTGGDLESENVGMQSIVDDIEEEHWMLSCLANKFTVRSDVFTAYILVRLGTDGPQRRMIAVFDRSQVWDKNDSPKLVALHPVPDPR